MNTTQPPECSLCSVRPMRRARVANPQMGIFALLACLFAPAAPGQCYYTWEQIPNPGGGWFCYGESINNHGHVAGVLRSGGDYTRGFVWTPETGTTVLPMPPGVYDLKAADINDLGHVVGSMIGPGGQVAYLWDGDTYTLIERPAWATGIVAASINNSDQVVGTVFNHLTGPSHAFAWEAGVLTDVDALIEGEYSGAHAVDERGVICGSSGDVLRSFVLRGQETAWLPHPVAFEASVVEGSSSNEFFAGWGSNQNPTRFSGVVWTPWETHVVPPPPLHRHLRLYRITSAGRAVGYYEGVPPNSGGAAAWQNGVLSVLSAMMEPGYPTRVDRAKDINEAGQIIATVAGTLVLTPVWRAGDLTGDCHVGFEDLILVLNNFGAPLGSFPMGDVDLDGDVDLADLAVLLSHWGG